MLGKKLYDKSVTIGRIAGKVGLCIGRIPLFALGYHVSPSSSKKIEFVSDDFVTSAWGGIILFGGGYITLAAHVNPALLLIPVATNLGSYIFEGARDVKKEHQNLLKEKQAQALRKNGKPVEIPLVKIDERYREELEQKVNHHGKH